MHTTTTNPAPHTPSVWIKLTIGLIGMFAFLHTYSLQSILPVLEQTFNANAVTLGMMVGATVFAIGLLSPFMGIVSDASGRKPLIVGCCVLMALPTLLLAGASSANAVVIYRFLQGLTIPGITVVTIAYISEEYKGSALTRLMAYYVSGTVLGGFLGRFILGHLHEWFGWRYGLCCMAAMMLLGAIWVAKMLPASQNFQKNSPISSAFDKLREHSKNPHLLSACALGACVLFSLIACFTYINLHLAAPPFSLRTATLSNIFAIYLLGVVITPFSARLIDRFGITFTIFAALCTSISGLLLTLSQSFWLVLVGLTIMSLGVFVTQSATISYIALNISKARSLAHGLYYMSYYTGGTIGAWLAGYAYQFGQWRAVVVLIVLVQLQGLFITKRFFKVGVT